MLFSGLSSCAFTLLLAIFQLVSNNLKLIKCVISQFNCYEYEVFRDIWIIYLRFRFRHLDLNVCFKKNTFRNFKLARKTIHRSFILSKTGNRIDTYQQFNTLTSYNRKLSVSMTLPKKGPGHTPQ